MAEEAHRPQSSDTATGDGEPDETVLRDAPASLAGLLLVYTVQEEGHQVDAHEVYDKNPSHRIVTYHTLPRFIAGYKKNLGRQEVSRARSQNPSEGRLVSMDASFSWRDGKGVIKIYLLWMESEKNAEIVCKSVFFGLFPLSGFRLKSNHYLRFEVRRRDILFQPDFAVSLFFIVFDCSRLPFHRQN